jgi:3-deoxy-D-manno-octulosonic acid hydroxylase-like protein
MSWITVTDYEHPGGWRGTVNRLERSRWYCQQLEQGYILFFAGIPFDLPQADRMFLVSQRSGESSIHKNISYRPRRNVLRGFSSGRSEDRVRLKRLMHHYSAAVTRFLSEFLEPYANYWSLDFASYRPVEEKGRTLPLHKRNDLLHVDAFPSRPTKGGRILRVFTNINPTESRVWNTTDHFDVLAQRFASDAGLEEIAAGATSLLTPLRRFAAQLLRPVGLPIRDRSAYDRFMLRFHDWLKENSEFQNTCPKIRLEFPPNSTWIVFTDAVPHAALSGQFALEHTYIVPAKVLLAPEKAPIHVLEGLCHRQLSV